HRYNCERTHGHDGVPLDHTGIGRSIHGNPDGQCPHLFTRCNDDRPSISVPITEECYNSECRYRGLHLGHSDTGPNLEFTHAINPCSIKDIIWHITHELPHEEYTESFHHTWEHQAPI